MQARESTTVNKDLPVWKKLSDRQHTASSSSAPSSTRHFFFSSGSVHHVYFDCWLWNKCFRSRETPDDLLCRRVLCFHYASTHNHRHELLWRADRGEHAPLPRRSKHKLPAPTLSLFFIFSSLLYFPPQPFLWLSGQETCQAKGEPRRMNMSTRWWDKWHTNWYIPAQEFDVIGSSIFLQSIRPRDAFPLRSPCQELSLSRRINSLAWMAARDRPIRWKTRRATRRRRKMWIYAPAVGRRTYEKKIDVIHKISRENTAVTTAWRAVTGHKLLSLLSSPNFHLHRQTHISYPPHPLYPLPSQNILARAIQGTTVLLSLSDTPTTRSNDLSSALLLVRRNEISKSSFIFWSAGEKWRW